jgi:hypothetical protein
MANVEAEADLSSGALRHHGSIIDIINGVKTGGVSLEEYNKLREKLKNKKTNRATLKASKKYQKKADDALSIELATQHQLVTALFYKVPIEEREDLMKSINTKNVDGNVTLISEYRKT